MRVSQFQPGEAPQLRVVVTAGESFGRIAARRPTAAILSRVAMARPTAPLGAASLSPQLEAAARAERTRLVGELASTAWRRAAAGARRLVAAWQRRRARRATVLALSGLDDRTLNDLGFGRGEILSVAMELGRDDGNTRMRTLRNTNAFQQLF